MILQLFNAYGIPALVITQSAMCLLLLKIAFNDLPHIYDEIRKVAERLATLEGVKEGVELARRAK